MAVMHSTMQPREFLDGLLENKVIKNIYEVWEWAAFIQTDEGEIPIGNKASWSRWLYQQGTPDINKRMLLALRYRELVANDEAIAA